MNYIQTLHARSIDLSLDRVDAVFKALMPNGISFKVMTIAGTNGKGSTSEIVASILRAANIKVGKYTSPHLISFNERFNLNGQNVQDDDLLNSFERVETARADVNLTFFEFGTLVAIDLFEAAQVDIAVMEVGLGGRLDAVNILEPEVTVITNIAIDHTAWLGDTLAEIAIEKFGVTRSDVPCVLGMKIPPEILLQKAQDKSVPIIQLDVDFTAETGSLATGADIWAYSSKHREFSDLPLPFGQAGHQVINAATALTAIDNLDSYFQISSNAIRLGLLNASNPGRCQILESGPCIIVDVAHNVASVAALANFIEGINTSGKLVAVCGMLVDKEIELALDKLAALVDVWHFASINNERGASSEFLSQTLESLVDKPVEIYKHQSVIEAYQSAKQGLSINDCLVVFGSFFVAGDILAQQDKE